MALRRVSLPSVLAVALVFTSIPAQAQSDRGGRRDDEREGVAARIAALESAVARLQGQLAPADLVGTYTFTSLQTVLFGANSAVPPQVEVNGSIGTVTLSADGTGSLSAVEHQTTLFLNPPFVSGGDAADAPLTFTWAYAAGTLTISVGGGVLSFSVTAGGNVLTAINSGGSGGAQSVNLLILTRLQ